MSRPALAAFLVLSCACAGAASIEVRVNDPSGAPVEDAAVWALAPSVRAEARGAKATVAQVDREFVPFLTVIQQGTAVSFPNRDPIMHHVYSFSPAKTFEFKLYTGRSPGEVVFDRPGVVALGCNIHDWMIGYLVVVPTPYFGRTDGAGIARLRDMPAGRYEVRAWHPRQAGPEATVAVEAADAAQARLVLDVKPPKPRYKPPLDRLRY